MTWLEVVAFVFERAGHRCEYCTMHQMLQASTFHIDHLLPVSRGGTDHPDNLCLSCVGCNLSKSSRTHLTDPTTGDAVPIFNPRTQAWRDHFAWVGFEILGLTPIGRALVQEFEVNHPRRVMIRQAEAYFGLGQPRG